jgi:preprotein translocase subunit SecG
MATFVMILQFILSVGLILAVTLQSSKGEGLGSIGGGAQLFFTPNRGIEAFLDKATTVLAVAFMFTSLLSAVLFLK